MERNQDVQVECNVDEEGLTSVSIYMSQSASRWVAVNL